MVLTEQSVADISVRDRAIHLTRCQGHVPLVIRLPRPVIKFVRAFDDGRYPELVEAGASRRSTTVQQSSCGTGQNSAAIEAARD
jgi:hypothetical protein